MLRRHLMVAVLTFGLVFPYITFAQQATPQKPPDRNPNSPIERIKDEGMNRSQVMQTLSYLTDVIGPRLTGSPSLKRANEWTRDRLTQWGLQNAHLEAWGPFGRGWALKKFSAQVVEPQAIPLIAYPKAWSPGLKEVLTADIVYIDAKDEAGLGKYKGKLKGAIVLTESPRELKAHFDPPRTRRTEKDLLTLADAQDPLKNPRRRPLLTPEARATFQWSERKVRFFSEEGAALLVDPSRAGDGGTIFVQSASVPQPPSDTPFDARRIQAWNPKAPPIVPQIVVDGENYNRMVRMIAHGEHLRMAVDLDVEFYEKDQMAYNTVAEIPGTDLKDEIVMLGGHMDSWHSGTGATDNGAGVAVAMEAVRILQALNLKPRRTIRIALWSGEEQGLFGSRAFVAEHLGKIGDGSQTASLSAILGDATSPPPVRPGVEYNKFSAYFNLDNGTGKVRGVYLQGNEGVRSIFRQWLEPFREMGATTLSISNTGGTDHLSFDAIGLPGFQFIQDEIEYSTRTHHSNQDVYDRIQADDMKQAATIMAAFIYNTAMLDEKLPRKPAAARPAPTKAAK